MSYLYFSFREILIWDACGDYWKFPKSQFEGSIVPYKPMFNDGWSPGYIVFEEEDQPKPAIRRNPSQNSNGNKQVLFQFLFLTASEVHGSTL